MSPEVTLHLLRLAGTPPSQPGRLWRPRLAMRHKALLAMLALLLLTGVLVGALVLLRGVLLQDLQQLSDPVARALQRHLDGALVLVICVAWAALTTLAALAFLYFARLARDLEAVRERAQAIALGARTPGPQLGWNDELSDLAQALDALGQELAQHERRLEIERRQLLHQEQLATLGTVAAGVLREIGNPLAAIDGYSAALAEQHPEQLAPLRAEVARLVQTMRAMAALTTPPAAARQLCSLNELVRQALTLLRYEPRLQGVQLVTQLDGQLPAIEAAPQRLLQLLLNVVLNAADALQGQGGLRRIELITERAASGLWLRVRDNGPGMRPEVQARAFEPLFSTRPGASGMGLTLCESIALDHGGRISLRSAPGEGCLALIWLPSPGLDPAQNLGHVAKPSDSGH